MLARGRKWEWSGRRGRRRGGSLRLASSESSGTFSHLACWLSTAGSGWQLAHKRNQMGQIVKSPPPTLTVIICQKALQPVRSSRKPTRKGARWSRARNIGGESGTLPAAAPVHGWMSVSDRLRCPSLVANSAGPATSTSAEQPAASPPLLPSITD